MIDRQTQSHSIYCASIASRGKKSSSGHSGIGKKVKVAHITERRVPELIPVLGSQPVTLQSLRELLPILLFGEQMHDGCEQFA